MTAPSDADEFTDFVSARWASLVRAAILLGCSRAEAEDVVQTALTRCYQHWGRVRRAADPAGYVHRTVVNAFIDTTRRKMHGELPVDAVRERPTEPAAHDIRLDVERSLGDLSAQQRLVVVLRIYLDLSEHQTAEILRIPPGTVKSRLARGLAVLAKDPRLASLTMEATDE